MDAPEAITTQWPRSTLQVQPSNVNDVSRVANLCSSSAINAHQKSQATSENAHQLGSERGRPRGQVVAPPLDRLQSARHIFEHAAYMQSPDRSAIDCAITSEASCRCRAAHLPGKFVQAPPRDDAQCICHADCGCESFLAIIHDGQTCRDGGQRSGRSNAASSVTAGDRSTVILRCGGRQWTAHAARPKSANTAGAASLQPSAPARVRLASTPCSACPAGDQFDAWNKFPSELLLPYSHQTPRPRSTLHHRVPPAKRKDVTSDRADERGVQEGRSANHQVRS